MVMIGSPLHLLWDFDREAPTLGGALVLRQEGERLAADRGIQEVVLHLAGESSKNLPDRLIQTVFKTSDLTFHITRDTAPPDAWPVEIERRQANFSYFSFSRLKQLYPDVGDTPRLRWSSEVEQHARVLRSRWKGRLICVHLRYVSPFSVEESSADGNVWGKVLNQMVSPGVLEFLLLGDDPLPPGMELVPGISRATDLQIDLATQLALVAQADGFLGMASGLCTAANLSAVPHVIFKHPCHHAEQMNRELGEADRFPFAGDKQRLWRRHTTVETIKEALRLILA